MTRKWVVRRRLVWIVGLVGLLLTQFPTAQLDAQENIWEFHERSVNSVPEDPGVVVDRSADGFTRNFTDEPAAEFEVDFPEMRIPTAQMGETHTFTVTVRGRIAGGADTSVQGFRWTDAILLVNGRWPASDPAVGVGVNCVTDIFGAPLGCTPPAGAWVENTATFSVTFPSSVPDNGLFTFGVGALNCGACLVEYVYRAATVEPDVPRCFGSPATVGDPDGDGTYVGTKGADVMIGTGRNEVFRGNGGNDKICAKGGRDRIVVGRGSSRVDGGKGKKDRITFTSPVTVSVSRIGGEGRMGRRTTTFRNVEIIKGSPEADTFHGPTTSITYIGGDGRDTVNFSNWDILCSRKGQGDSVEFVAAPYPNFNCESYEAPGTVAETVDIERVIGTPSVDNFNAALPWTYGGKGADRIWLRKGERGFGGAGRDTIYLRQPGVERAQGGPGSDWLRFRHKGFPKGVEVDLGEGTIEPRLGGPTTKVKKIEAVSGTDSKDVLRGGRGNDQLFGGRRADVLVGRGGDDVLIGGTGRDLAKGGSGVDTCDAETQQKCERAPD